MRYYLPLLLLLTIGCTQSARDCDWRDSGLYFDYSGTYAASLDGSVNGDTYTDEFNIVVQQNGPAIMLANVLARGDADGLSFGHTYTAPDPWLANEMQVVTYSGSSRPLDPYVIDLLIEVRYPNLDAGWDVDYEYVITLGERL